jgi:hypothetical protein
VDIVEKTHLRALGPGLRGRRKGYRRGGGRRVSIIGLLDGVERL